MIISRAMIVSCATYLGLIRSMNPIEPVGAVMTTYALDLQCLLDKQLFPEEKIYI